MVDEITDSHKASTVASLAVTIEPLADACSNTVHVCMPAEDALTQIRNPH